MRGGMGAAVMRSLFDRAVDWARIGAVVTLAITLAGMLVPGSDLPRDLPPDLLLHALGFGLPALLAAFAAGGRRGLASGAAVIACVALASEPAQALVPGRTVSGLDLAGDAVGIGIGTSLGWLIRLGLLWLFRAASRGQS